MLGFWRMVSKLNPRYVLPSRSYFSRTAIPGLYTEVREEIEHELAQQAVCFAGTTDLWTSASSNPYISFAVHYINGSRATV